MAKSKNTPSQSDSLRSYKFWVFTYFPVQETFDLETRNDVEIMGLCMNALQADDYVFQIERCPTTEAAHLQGMVDFVKPYTLTQLKEKLRGLGPAAETIHFEPRYGSKIEAETYCQKAETRIAGPYHKHPPGDRIFVPQLVEWINSDQKSVPDVAKTPVQQTLWNLYLEEMAKPQDRVSYIIDDACGGIGKTTWCRQMYTLSRLDIRHKIHCLSMFDTMRNSLYDLATQSESTSLVIIDIPRPLSYNKAVWERALTLCEMVKGRQINSTMYGQNRSTIFSRSPMCVIMCNHFLLENEKGTLWSEERFCHVKSFPIDGETSSLV